MVTGEDVPHILGLTHINTKLTEGGNRRWFVKDGVMLEDDIRASARGRSAGSGTSLTTLSYLARREVRDI